MRDASKKRKFEQSIELVINTTGIDFKKAENRIDLAVELPHATSKQSAVKPLVFVRDKDFASQLKDRAKAIDEADIPKIKKKELAELMENYNAFFAEAPVMVAVGKHLGQELAPKGRMPRPIEPRMASFESALKNVRTGMRVSNNKGKYMPVVHAPIGKEKFTNDQLADNALAVYNAVAGALSQKEQNIKSAYVKLTMGPAIGVKLGK